jgi:hypothetical protein
MNGKVFNELNQLKYVQLDENVCIDGYFSEETQLSSLKQKVDKKCGFDEPQLTNITIDKLKEVLCEQFAEIERDDEFFQFCFMNDTTTIEAMNATISTKRDDFIKGLWFNSNKNIFYLPIQVVEQFSNLAIIQADDCNVKQISNANFKKLSKLRWLSLEHNQIQTVETDTFNDLAHLEFLSLGKNFFVSQSLKSELLPLQLLTKSNF